MSKNSENIDQAVEEARRNEESAARAERRERQEIRRLVDSKLSQHDAVLQAAYQALKDFVHARGELDRARAEAAAAERVARTAGVLDRTHRSVEIAFFDSPGWRAFDFELRPLLGGGKILG